MAVENSRSQFRRPWPAWLLLTSQAGWFSVVEVATYKDKGKDIYSLSGNNGVCFATEVCDIR